VALLASPAFAQQQRQRGQGQGQGQRQGGFGGGMGGGGLAMLLLNESVQKELKLDEVQVAKTKDAVSAVQKAHAEDFTKLRDVDQAERPAKQRELNKTVSDEILKGCGDILKAEQIKRLNQIELQNAGTAAFTRPEVEKGLSLKDEQKEKIKTISEETTKALRELQPMRGQGGQGGGQGNFAANAEKRAAINKEAKEKIQGVLTDEQKTAWKDMTGDAFTVVMPMGRRPMNPPTN
jgi:hypothetical protein